MAGLFQLLNGGEEGFSKPVAVEGSDEEPLIIPATEENIIRAICTRPTAVDINGDGNLDIVSGNFEGTFFVFLGEGQGAFDPDPYQLMAGDKPLTVAMHSDPFFVDWDNDGDQDLLSGSADGGVQLFVNSGSAKEAKFGKAIELLAGKGGPGMLVQQENPEEDETGLAEAGTGEGAELEGASFTTSTPPVVFGDAHITGPQGSTRVWADDINGDGKIDLLVGDSAMIENPAKGLDAIAARAKLIEWDMTMNELMGGMQGEEEPSEEVMNAWKEHYEKRSKIVETTNTGYVWVMYQK